MDQIIIVSGSLAKITSWSLEEELAILVRNFSGGLWMAVTTIWKVLLSLCTSQLLSLGLL